VARACALIILKSIIALALHWLATRRFARAEFSLGQRLLGAYVRSSWEERSKRSSAEVIRISDVGIANSMAGIILTTATIPGYALTIVLLFAVLAVAQPATALITIVYLGIVGGVLSLLIGPKALQASRVNLHYGHRVSILIIEIIDALKELTLRGRLGDASHEVDERRKHAVQARANSSFLAVVPRYAFEGALIGGFVLVGFFTFLADGMEAAIAAIALFAAAGFRLVPAISGLQSSMLTATASVPWTLEVISDIRAMEAAAVEPHEAADAVALPSAPTTLTVRGVGFHYPNTTRQVLEGLDLEIPFGSSLGIVGPSGAGKSTLIDLLLGLSTPTRGEIAIDDLPLRDVVHTWRSRVGYVPQRVALFDGTIAQNVALTWGDDYDRDRVVIALERAQLASLVASREQGIDERIGERGGWLSGGQQQRLGIARALYADPLVLVFDEATSSLDTKTEDDVVQAIKALHGDVTVIAVAHRISTIKDYDQICYLDQGRILGKGPFLQLAASLPQFGLQVQLAGLSEGAEPSA
jgi:ATP-binding cassette, subfamily B, bacterial PglK